MEYFLGLDWGEKKYGLALADKETRLAFALKNFAAGKLEEELEQIRQKFSCQEIILGISQGYAFSKNNKKKILALKNNLEKKGWEVFLSEESFSTLLAQKNLQEKSGGKKRKSGEDDAEAARLILQSWLDKNQEKC